MREIEFIGKCMLISSNEKKILVIGDLHLGYEGALRETGVLVGDELLKEYESYLERVFDKVGKVQEIILLGDVKHVIGKIIKEEWSNVLSFLDYLKEKCDKIVIVRGQHDALVEPIIKKRKEIKLREYYISGKYGFLHGDKAQVGVENADVKYWIVGNAHPAVKISDGIKIEKYKCFLIGEYKDKKVIIVPSFIYNNEGSDPRENDLGMAWKFKYNKFKVIVVGEDLKDLEFGKLEKLS